MAQSGLQKPAQSPNHVPHDSAMSVGSSSTREENVAKIRDLESEVQELAEKANAASQRFADYENEIRVLQAKLRQEQRKNSAVSEPNDGTQAATQSALRPGISRFGSFIGSRKTEAPQQNGSLPIAGKREKELEDRLIKEQTTRIAAERKLQDASAEIEDLTAALFQNANEMVAAERKENAALKERIENLEHSQTLEKQSEVTSNPEALQKENERLKDRVKTLERREDDRKKRLERLESAQKRIERARTLLAPP